jgi:hypothetical protein
LFFYQNASKTIIRQSSNNLTISIYNNYYANTLLTDTNANGTAPAAYMTSWSAMLEFIPIPDSMTILTKCKYIIIIIFLYIYLIKMMSIL